MNEELQKISLSPEIMESIILKGDISGLNTLQKIDFYKAYCQRIGLDPAAMPFKILKLQGKETLYLDRSGAQQLNKLHKVSHQITSRELIQEAGIYQVTARASTSDRFTESIGAVNIGGLKGDAYANAIMKAETKAKRRSTLDLLGLGILDETEVETIPKAEIVEIPIEVNPQVVDQINECISIDETKEIYKDLPEGEKKAYKNIITQRQIEIAESNIEEIIKNLRKNSYQKQAPNIEMIIDKEKDKDRRQYLINIYNEKLEKIGVDYRYESLPF